MALLEMHGAVAPEIGLAPLQLVTPSPQSQTKPEAGSAMAEAYYPADIIQKEVENSPACQTMLQAMAGVLEQHKVLLSSDSNAMPTAYTVQALVYSWDQSRTDKEYPRPKQEPSAQEKAITAHLVMDVLDCVPARSLPGVVAGMLAARTAVERSPRYGDATVHVLARVSGAVALSAHYDDLCNSLPEDRVPEVAARITKLNDAYQAAKNLITAEVSI